MTDHAQEEPPVYAFELSDDKVNDKEKAQLIRGMLLYRTELLAVNPWMSFPQNACCFSYGKDNVPMPVGVLFLLWDQWALMTGACTKECGGKVYGYAYGGLLSVGGVFGVCLKCERRMFRFVGGGIGCIHTLASVVLNETPYRHGIGMFGGCIGSSGGELRATLERLGCTDLPPKESVEKMDASAATLEIDSSG